MPVKNDEIEIKSDLEVSRTSLATITFDPAVTADEKAQMQALIFAWQIYCRRNQQRQGVWRRAGLRGNVVFMYAKAERVFRATFGHGEPELDDMLDMINYAAMSSRLHTDGGAKGEWPWGDDA